MERSGLHRNIPDVLKRFLPSTSARPVAISNPEYCLPCAMRFFSDVAAHDLHKNSEEHAIMVLVTGISYVESVDAPTEIPLLYKCILCRFSSFEFDSYKSHLFDLSHQEISQFLRDISFWKETVIIGMGCKEWPETADNISELKVLIPNYCRLCDKQCRNFKTFKLHKRGKVHKSVEQNLINCKICNISFVNLELYEIHLGKPGHESLKLFRQRLLIREEEMTRTNVLQTEEGEPPVTEYICHVCDFKFTDEEFFRRHVNTSLHARTLELRDRIALERSEQDAGSYNEPDSFFQYCEDCKLLIEVTPVNTYDDHLTSGRHLGSQKVKFWNVSPEKPKGLRPWQ